jgi:membrane-associated phospholipid phosphatase
MAATDAVECLIRTLAHPIGETALRPATVRTRDERSCHRAAVYHRLVRLQARSKIRRELWLALTGGLALWSLAAPASGQEPPPDPTTPPDATAPTEHRLRWQWRHFGAIDYAYTAAVAAGYLSVEFGAKPPAQPRWRGGISFDRAVRRALVAETRGARDAWNTASDVLALIPQGMMLIDSLFVPLLSDHWNTEVAWHLTVIAVQSEALTGLLSRSGHYGIARARPDTEPCIEDPSYSTGCFRGTSASFPGGHVASASVGAGVVCAHHLHLPLYGGGFWDTAACLTNVGFAAATGYARMAADRHYVSDTLVGAALGAAVGFLLPSLVHYRGGASAAREGASWRWTIAAVPIGDDAGLGIYGWF